MKKSHLYDFLYNIAGSILYAAGIDTFAGAAGFAPGGVSGLALILNHLWGLPVGIMTLVLNVPLVLISYKAVGKKIPSEDSGDHAYFNIFPGYCISLFPLYRGQRLLAAVYSGVLLGGGMVLFYLRGSSSGGIDFLTMAIKKKHPSFSLGKSP